MTEHASEATMNNVAAKPRPRWGRILVWVALIAFLVLIGLGLLAKQQGQMKIGQRAPDFALTTFEGEQITLSSLKGKVVLVNFWASWCQPCEQEAADLEATWRFYKPRGDVVYLGVDWTDTDANAKIYMEKYAVTYINGPDLGTRISQRYRTTGVPETYIVDRNGNLAYVKFSPFVSQAEIQAAIDPLLK